MITFWSAAKYGGLSSIVKTALRGNPIENRVEKVGTAIPYVPAGSVLLAMGTTAVNLAKAHGLLPKARTITSLRGKPVPMEDAHLMVTFDPAICEIDAGKESEIVWDVQLAARLATTGSLSPEIGDYRYVPDLRDVIIYIKLVSKRLIGKPVDVSLDLETMGLYPWYPDKHIISLSISVGEGVADVIYIPHLSLDGTIHPHVRDQLVWLLSSPLVSMRGANLKFDLLWLMEKWGLVCTNFRMDTMLVGSLLNENRSNSLNVHAKTYTSMGGYDDALNAKHDKAHMELVPTEDLLPYAGGDTDAALRTSNSMRKELSNNLTLQRFYVKLLHPAARAFEKVERNGVLVDVEKMGELRQELSTYIGGREDSIIGAMPARLRNKHRSSLDKSKAQGKSPFTAAILRELFFSPLGYNFKPKMTTEKTNAPSTTHEHFMLFQDKAGDVVGLLDDLSSARKTLSTYVDGFMNHLRPDGRFHPTYMLFNGSAFGAKNDDAGTVTGRTSARDPAVQTLPKHTQWAKKLRACYPAPPGKSLFHCDFSQGELRIAACVADETTMIKAYKEGVDLHALTGSRLSGRTLKQMMALKGTEEFNLARQRAKAGNFGLIYGMAHAGYKIYAKSSYGVTLTTEEAEKDVENFFGLYAKLRPWHAAYKALAANHGYVTNPLGRVRHLPLAKSDNQAARSMSERQAINSPIQSCLSDLCLWAIAELDRRYGIEGELEVIGMTHDSIYGYVPEDTAVEWATKVAAVMSSLPIEQTFGWTPQLVFEADSEVGSTLAALSPVK